jgi:uncharacterized protein (DUF952 family)
VLVYKILLPAEWAAFEADGRFDGSPFDERSGFIHLSTREQLGRTAGRFFADVPDLVVVALDVQVLGEWLKWEMAGDGGTYPHAYAPLPRSAVHAVHRIAGASSVEAVVPAGG